MEEFQTVRLRCETATACVIADTYKETTGTANGELVQLLQEDVSYVGIANRYVETLVASVTDPSCTRQIMRCCYTFIFETLNAMKIAYTISVDDFCCPKKRAAYNWIVDNLDYREAAVDDITYQKLAQVHVSIGTLVGALQNCAPSCAHFAKIYASYANVWHQIAAPIAFDVAPLAGLREPIGRISYAILCGMETIYAKHGDQLPFLEASMVQLVGPTCLTLCYPYLQEALFKELMCYISRHTKAFCQKHDPVTHIVKGFLRHQFSSQMMSCFYESMCALLQELEASTSSAPDKYNKVLSRILINGELLAIYEQMFDTLTDTAVSRQFLNYLHIIIVNLENVKVIPASMTKSILKNYWRRDLSGLSKPMIALYVCLLRGQEQSSRAEEELVIRTLYDVRNEQVAASSRTPVDVECKSLLKRQLKQLISQYEQVGQFQMYLNHVARPDLAMSIRLLAVEVADTLLSIFIEKLPDSDLARSQCVKLLKHLPALIDSTTEHEATLRQRLLEVLEHFNYKDFSKYVKDSDKLLAKIEDYFSLKFKQYSPCDDMTASKLIECFLHILKTTGNYARIDDLSLTISKHFNAAKKRYMKMLCRKNTVSASVRSGMLDVVKRLSHAIAFGGSKLDKQDILNTLCNPSFYEDFCSSKPLQFGDVLFIGTWCIINVENYDIACKTIMANIKILCSGGFREVASGNNIESYRMQWFCFKSLELIARNYEVLGKKIPRLVSFVSLFCVMTDWLTTSVDTPSVKYHDEFFFYVGDCLRILVDICQDVRSDTCCWTIPMRYRTYGLETRNFDNGIEKLMRYFLEKEPGSYVHLLALIIVNLHYYGAKNGMPNRATAATHAHVHFVLKVLGRLGSRQFRVCTFFQVLGILHVVLYLSKVVPEIDRLLPLNTSCLLISDTGLSSKEIQIALEFVRQFAGYNLNGKEHTHLDDLREVLMKNLDSLLHDFESLQIPDVFDDMESQAMVPEFLEISDTESLRKRLLENRHREILYYIRRFFEAFDVQSIFPIL